MEDFRIFCIIPPIFTHEATCCIMIQKKAFKQSQKGSFRSVKRLIRFINNLFGIMKALIHEWENVELFIVNRRFLHRKTASCDEQNDGFSSPIRI